MRKRSALIVLVGIALWAPGIAQARYLHLAAARGAIKRAATADVKDGIASGFHIDLCHRKSPSYFFCGLDEYDASFLGLSHMTIKNWVLVAYRRGHVCAWLPFFESSRNWHS